MLLMLHGSRERVQGGLSSGEGLIWAVRDPIYRVKKPRKGEECSFDDPELELEDPGINDKRLLCVESEFGQTLQNLKRESNTLSPVLRLAWDGSECLQSLTKTSKAMATGAHFSMMCHITKEELMRIFDEVEKANGLSNRILWFCVRRSKYLPLGEPTPTDVLNELSAKLAEAITFATKQNEITMDETTKKAWCSIYPALSDGGDGGLAGAALARGPAHVRRLMMLYALLDCSAVIQITHLSAAIAVWEYVQRSAKYIFGSDDVIDETMRKVVDCLQSGRKSQTEIYNFFNRNVPAKKIRSSLEALSASNKVTALTIPGKGIRPATFWELVS